MHICSRSTLLDLSNDPKVPHFSSYYTPGATAHSTYRTYTQQYSRDLADARPSPRPTGRRTQQELRHGGPSARAPTPHEVHQHTPSVLPASRPRSEPRCPQRPARTAHRPPRRASVGQALPACVRVTAFYLSVPVRAFSSALEAEYSSGIFTAKVQSSEFIRAYQQQTDIFTPAKWKTHAAKLSRTQPGRCGRCRCWGRPR